MAIKVYIVFFHQPITEIYSALIPIFYNEKYTDNLNHLESNAGQQWVEIFLSNKSSLNPPCFKKVYILMISQKTNELK